MKPKIVLCLLLMISMLAFAGCSGDTGKSGGDSMAKDATDMMEDVGDDVKNGAKDMMDTSGPAVVDEEIQHQNI